MASLLFALWHAKNHGMSRIIYVIPYTSIIDQNAEKFREILGEGNVLEHHSGVQFDLSDGAGTEEIRKALAVENWDMPVVVTTAVQFFESLYANIHSRNTYKVSASKFLISCAINSARFCWKASIVSLNFCPL